LSKNQLENLWSDARTLLEIIVKCDKNIMIIATIRDEANENFNNLETKFSDYRKAIPQNFTSARKAFYCINYRPKI
jgi:hypothetical protein